MPVPGGKTGAGRELALIPQAELAGVVGGEERKGALSRGQATVVTTGKQGYGVELAPTVAQRQRMGQHAGLSRVVENFASNWSRPAWISGEPRSRTVFRKRI